MPPPLPVNIYTDGACSGNPGPGGYAALLEAPGYPTKELCKGFRLTTNNRMELLAVIDGLRALKTTEVDVTVFTDSRYVADAVNLGWVFAWHKKGFAGKKNPDLWKTYLTLHQKFKPKLVWIKGHNNHPQNERCDKLAVEASKASALYVDEWFEQNRERDPGIFG